MTLCSSSLRLAGVSAATKMVFGVTGRQNVFDSSAVISSASLQGDAVQVNANAARGVIGIEQNVDAGQPADALVNRLGIFASGSA